MSILDEIDDLKRTIADGLERLGKATDAGGQALQEEAKRLQDQLAAFVAAPVSVKLADGREIQVSERDALRIAAAIALCLARKPAKVTFASGQTEALLLTDLEQLAQAVLG